MDQAEQKQAAQDFRGAANAYEKALDGTPKTADAHFRLGLLYDGKLNDPVGAVHHFRRYLEFLPGGPHAKEAKANLDRIELDPRHESRGRHADHPFRGDAHPQ